MPSSIEDTYCKAKACAVWHAVLFCACSALFWGLVFGLFMGELQYENNLVQTHCKLLQVQFQGVQCTRNNPQCTSYAVATLEVQYKDFNHTTALVEYPFNSHEMAVYHPLNDTIPCAYEPKTRKIGRINDYWPSHSDFHLFLWFMVPTYLTTIALCIYCTGKCWFVRKEHQWIKVNVELEAQ